MRAKLAVFAAAAVVFAPGWGAEGIPQQKPSPSDVAARMLAPTFEEADRSTSVKKRSERPKPRDTGNNYLSFLTVSSEPEPPRELILSAIVAFAFVTACQSRRTRSRRAPPLLLTG